MKSISDQYLLAVMFVIMKKLITFTGSSLCR